MSDGTRGRSEAETLERVRNKVAGVQVSAPLGRGHKMSSMGRAPSKEEIFELSTDERLHLIESLWDSLPPHEIPIPDWHKEILDERLEDHRRNPGDSVSWEELKDELFPKR